MRGLATRSMTSGRGKKPNGSLKASGDMRTLVRIFASGMLTVPGLRPETSFLRSVNRITVRPSTTSRWPTGFSGFSRSSAQQPGKRGGSRYSRPCTSACVRSS